MSVVYHWQHQVKVELLRLNLGSWIIPLDIAGDEAAGGEEPDKETDRRAWKVWLMDYSNGRIAMEISLGQYGEVITQDPRYTELPQWCSFLERYRVLESLLREQVVHSSVSQSLPIPKLTLMSRPWYRRMHPIAPSRTVAIILLSRLVDAPSKWTM
jgi:hypothetical protein